MNFETAVAIIFEHEGGYSHDPKDAGGETRYGISKRAYPNLDIKNLTKSEAREIYKRDYWNAIDADKLPEYLRLIAFDCAVNQGVNACKAILKSIVTGQSERQKLAFFVDQRLIRYARNSAFSHFGLGWTRRLIDILLRSIG